MFIDNNFAFASQQNLSGATSTNSTNVYNAGSAKKLFGGAGEPVSLAVHVTAAGGTSPTIQAKLVGADDSGLSSNVIVIADTGVSPALAASDLPYALEVVPAQQKTAKQYYGVIFVQTGTSPTATVNAALTIDAQSNLLK
jgi:hypothetical protein